MVAKKKYEVADVEKLEKFKGQFDMVLCHNVLYHAEDKNKALKNLNECLNNNVNSFCSITTNSEKHMLNVYEIGRNLDKNFPTDRIIDTFTEEIADELLKNHFKPEKKVEEEELRVTDWEILKGFVASGVEPRGIKLVSDFYENYKKNYDQEFKKNGYFRIIKRSTSGPVDPHRGEGRHSRESSRSPIVDREETNRGVSPSYSPSRGNDSKLVRHEIRDDNQ